MKKSLCVTVGIVLMTAAFAAAQTPRTGVTADVPFAFLVNGKLLPAGTYKFTAGANLAQITVASPDGKASAMTTVTTRVSPRSESDGSIVFDLAGQDHYLAEIYVPGIDGFQVPCAPSPHTHVVLKASK
jgi:hypothetical protein